MTEQEIKKLSGDFPGFVMLCGSGEILNSLDEDHAELMKDFSSYCN